MPGRTPLLLTLAMAGAVAACGSRADRPQPPVAAATGQRLQVRREPVADEKVVAATVETRDQAEARARIGGVLTVLKVRAGDTVRRGEAIGRVVDQRLNFQTSAADAQVAAAAAEAARAEAELGRTTYLYDNGVYAKARLEQVQAQAKASQGTLAAARAQRAASADLAGQGAILAPSDGRVLKADVPAGSVVQPGQSVATLTAGPPVLRLEIPEADARALKVGQAVAIFPEDLPGVAGAAISQIYPAVDVGRVVADVTVPGLRPELIGQRVRARLAVGRRSALLVPRSYVAHRYGLDYARVVDRNGQAMDVAVQLAPPDGSGRVEVLSGLSDGDVIVPPGA
jgi:RND family efflux transporter MFP subunit